MQISIETVVKATLAQVWDAWVTPTDITSWNFAIDEWCCPSAELNLEVGGVFKYRMAAKDGSMAFDFRRYLYQGHPTKYHPFCTRRQPRRDC